MPSDLIPMGDGAWRFSLPEGADPVAALEALRSQPRVLDAVVAGTIALVRFDPAEPPDDPRSHLVSLRPVPRDARPLHLIPARYDGEDLEEVARLAGLTRAEVIERHVRMEYTVEFVGFLPGFAYLGPVDPALAVPRCATPRPRVPAGAIGLAAGRTGVYPFVSPGGWQLIGTAENFAPFDPQRGAILQLGDRVRFQAID